MDNDISRRTFLGSAAMGALGLAWSGTFAGTALAASSASASASSAPASASAAGPASASASATSASASASASAAASTSVSVSVDERYTADLTDIYPDSAAFDADAARIENELLPALQEAADKAVELLDAQESDTSGLIAYLECYDEFYTAFRKASQYVGLRLCIDSSDQEALNENGVVSRISIERSPITAEVQARLATVDESQWQKYLASDDLAPWHCFMQRSYEARTHVISSSDEKLLTGAYAAKDNITTLFTTLVAADFYLSTTTDPEGDEVLITDPVYSAAMDNPDRSYRERALHAYYGSLAKAEDIFASNLNAFVRLSEDIVAAYGYNSVLESSMVDSDIDVTDFDALIAGTRENLPAYGEGNELRAQALGIDKVMPWDRVASWADAPVIDYSYEDAQAIILEALAPLGQDYVDKLQEIFSHRWIDVYPAAGKPGGEVTYLAEKGGHPYIVMNYTGDYYSVDNLAHELGHFIHSMYSVESQDIATNVMPSSLTSEVASIANEVLFQDYCIEHAENDAQKLYYLSQEISLIEMTFFRQVMFATFEEQLHQAVIDGETLTADRINGLFNQTYAEFCPGITVTDDNALGWAYVQHFYYNFYVQNYAFAIAAAYNVVAGIQSGDETMLENYKEFLCAGDSKPGDELFALIGIDLEQGDYITPLIKKYRSLLEQAKALL